MVVEKKEIRKQFKKKRESMSPNQVAEWSYLICEHILSSDIFREAGYILAYSPLGKEADIRRVVEEAWRQGKQVAFPRVCGDDMSFFEVACFSQLHPGTFGVMEPEETHPVEWTEKVLVLVPGVAFDPQGNRMGFGRGYYDRYLSSLSDPVTLGVAYGLQIAKQIPVEHIDVPLKYLVTERGMISSIINN